MKNFVNTYRELLRGVALCFIIAFAAYLMILCIPGLRIIGHAVLSIGIGMLIGNIVQLSNTHITGIGFTSKKILQWAIILLGFEMHIDQVVKTGCQTLMIMLITLLTTLLMAFVIGKLLKVPDNSATLIGVGTAICGGSAIAAVAPVIRAKEDEVAQSISTIFLFNVIAVFLFPALGHAMGLSQTTFGIWAGTAINDTSSVVAAASSYGTEALQVATVVKLTRALMILPVTLLLAFYVTSKQTASGEKLHITKIFPTFIIGFLIASLLCTLIPGQEAIFNVLSQSGKFMISMAMAAIGLKTNIMSLIKNGKRPILLGLICWVSVAGVSLIVQSVLWLG